MEQSTLTEILGVEREIRAQLDAERAKAGRWLEATRQEIEQAHAVELAALRAAAGPRRSAALQAARDEAAALVRTAEEAARARATVGDDVLRALVRRHLAGLLPGDAG